MWVLLLAGLIKLPIAALMLWIPFRYDESPDVSDASDSSEEDGGSKALPGRPAEPPPAQPAAAPPAPRTARLPSPSSRRRASASRCALAGRARRGAADAASGSSCAAGAPPWLSRGACAGGRRGRARRLPSARSSAPAGATRRASRMITNAIASSSTIAAPSRDQDRFVRVVWFRSLRCSSSRRSRSWVRLPGPSARVR